MKTCTEVSFVASLISHIIIYYYLRTVLYLYENLCLCVVMCCSRSIVALNDIII